MKQFLVVLCTGCALGFLSCKKDMTEQLPVPTEPSFVLEKNPLVGNRTLEPRDTTIVLFDMVSRTTEIPQNTLVMGTLRMSGSNGLPVASLKQLTISVKDMDGVHTWQAEIASVGRDGIDFQFTSAGIRLPAKTTIDTFRISAVIPDTLRGTLAGSLELFCWSPSQGNKSSLATTQTITFAAPRLVVTSNSLTPATKLILDEAEDTALVVNFTAQGGDITLDGISIGVNDVSLVNSIRLYDGATLASSNAQFIGATTTLPMVLTIANGTTKTFVIKPFTRNITSATQSRSILKTTVVGVQYHIAGGPTRTAATTIGSNNQYLVKSYIKITRHTITQPLQNNALREIVRFTVETFGGPSSWKSAGNNIVWGDQIDNNSLVLDSLQFWKNDINTTSLVKFYNEDGQLDSVFSESNSKLTIAWITEDIVIPGAPVTYTLKAVARGFGAGNGDVVQLSAPTDPISSIDYSRLTRSGTASQQTPKLANPSGNIQDFSVIWSDLSAGVGVQHSSNIQVGSTDWFSGALTEGEGYTQTLVHP